MGAEIFDVEINLDGVIIKYATKAEFKRNKDTNTTLTFDGDVNTGAANTGATISVEGLVYPTDIQEAIDLEKKLESQHLEKVTISGTSFTKGGVAYRKTIHGLGVTVSTDDEAWGPSDGITQSLELKVNKLIKEDPEPL